MDDPQWTLSEDKKTLVITFPTNPPTAFRLDAAGVDKLIQTIGIVRFGMIPPHLSDWKMAQTVGAVPNPRWTTEPDALLGNSILHLRDPRFGWVHYMFPKEEARRLGEILQRQADTAPPIQGSDRPH
jgi:hypothetical protein